MIVSINPKSAYTDFELDSEIYEFLADCRRAELDENPRVYKKALRAALLALGFEDSFVNGTFREMMDDFYGK